MTMQTRMKWAEATGLQCRSPSSRRQHQRTPGPSEGLHPGPCSTEDVARTTERTGTLTGSTGGVSGAHERGRRHMELTAEHNSEGWCAWRSEGLPSGEPSDAVTSAKHTSRVPTRNESAVEALLCLASCCWCFSFEHAGWKGTLLVQGSRDTLAWTGWWHGSCSHSATQGIRGERGETLEWTLWRPTWRSQLLHLGCAAGEQAPP